MTVEEEFFASNSSANESGQRESAIEGSLADEKCAMPDGKSALCEDASHENGSSDDDASHESSASEKSVSHESSLSEESVAEGQSSPDESEVQNSLEKSDDENFLNESESDENSPSKEQNKLSNRIKAYGAEFVATIKQFGNVRFSAAYLTKLAFLTAIAFVLYSYAKFPLPIFPSFLDMQLSELPALLAGFSMGPVSGALVIVFKCLLKMLAVPSSTGFSGELTDILLGILFVVPASLVYHLRSNKGSAKSGMLHAIAGLVVGTVMLSCMSLVINRYISIPIYSKLFGFDNIVGMVSGLYDGVTAENFYTYYLLLGVLPFNLLRCIIVSLVTFLIYKRLSVILHWEGKSLKKPLIGEHKVKSVAETNRLAARLADELVGGEIVLLNGDLGAGKTTFTKALFLALGVTEEVTSPTFTILNVYEAGDLKLNHIDLYRVENEEEIEELGLYDCMTDASVTVIEWNKLENLSGTIYTIDFVSTGETSRTITIKRRD